MSKPRIGIVFYGIPRGGGQAYPAIVENIIIPASELGQIQVRYHFYNQKHVYNPLSAEIGPLPASDYAPFLCHKGELSAPEIIYNSFDVKHVFSFGDAWGDGFISTSNLLRQLYSLQRVAVKILEFEPELVVFARPDLLYHDSLAGPILLASEARNHSVARLPNWHWASGGYNDRFAICTGRAIRSFGLRLQLVDSFLLETGGPLHSEVFLKYALDRALIAVRPFPQTASRIRIGGRVVCEKFTSVTGSRLIKHWTRELAKSIVANL